MLRSADDSPLVFPGCYQLRDTLGSTPIPERFALQTLTDRAAPRNVVRALTADGRPDSVLAGLTWQATPGLASSVLITRGSLIASGFRRQVIGVADVRLNRIECR
jgi:hypothetical protein